MSRIRSIKPEFWSSESIADVCRDARLLFIALWNFADDVGRGQAGPRGVRMRVFPGDADMTDERVGNLLDELASKNLIQIYEVEGQKYYLVLGFEKHQRVNKPQPPRFPAPPRATRRPAKTKTSEAVQVTDDSVPIPGTFTESDAPSPGTNRADWNGLEGNGMEGSGSSRATPDPSGWGASGAFADVEQEFSRRRSAAGLGRYKRLPTEYALTEHVVAWAESEPIGAAEAIRRSMDGFFADEFQRRCGLKFRTWASDPGAFLGLKSHRRGPAEPAPHEEFGDDPVETFEPQVASNA